MQFLLKIHQLQQYLEDFPFFVPNALIWRDARFLQAVTVGDNFPA
jgi:hypothetical protein